MPNAGVRKLLAPGRPGLEAVGFTEALLNFYRTTRRTVPEDYILQSHRHKVLIFRR